MEIPVRLVRKETHQLCKKKPPNSLFVYNSLKPHIIKINKFFKKWLRTQYQRLVMNHESHDNVFSN